MSAEQAAIELGEEGPNEFTAIENFLITMLPNNGQVGEDERKTILTSSSYDKQALRSNIILNMANLIEMVTFLDNPDDEIEQDTITSIDILAVEVLAEMQRYAFVLNGGDPKLFIGRVLSAFNWLELNPPASTENTAVRYLEEALAYFIQEDEDDVKGYLRALEQINVKRPDLQAWKWVGGQMFARTDDLDMESSPPLNYVDFVEMVVAPYEQAAQEREERRTAEYFGETTAAAAQERPFIEEIDELARQGQAIGEQVEGKIGSISVVDNESGSAMDIALNETPTAASTAERWAANAMANIEQEASERGISVQDVLKEKITDTTGVDSSYPEKLTTFSPQPPSTTLPPRNYDVPGGEVEMISMDSRFYVVYNDNGHMWVQTKPQAETQERFDLGDLVDVFSDGGLPIGESKIVEIKTGTGQAEVWMRFVYPDEHGEPRYKLDGEDFMRQAHGALRKNTTVPVVKPFEFEGNRRPRLIDQVLDNNTPRPQGTLSEFIDEQVAARKEAKKEILAGKAPLQDSEYFARRARSLNSEDDREPLTDDDFHARKAMIESRSYHQPNWFVRIWNKLFGG